MNENRDLNQRENGINPSELSGKGDYYFSNGVQERTPRTTPVGTKRKPAKKSNGVKSTYVFFIVVIAVSMALSVYAVFCMNDILAITKTKSTVTVSMQEEVKTASDAIDLLADQGLIKCKGFCKFFATLHDKVLNDPIGGPYPAGVYYLNGKMGLSEAEAVHDLITARTAEAAQNAAAQVMGAVGSPVQQMRDELLGMVAHFHAVVDFPDEDIDPVLFEDAAALLHRTTSRLYSMAESYERGRILREGVPCVILGRPNAGKSTLLNTLLGRERAIVTDIPGTTRDLIEENVKVGQILLRVTDTAGLRNTDDPVEQAGIDRAMAEASASSLILAVFDGSKPISDEDMLVLARSAGHRAIAVVNKVDLPQQLDEKLLKKHFLHIVPLSAKTGDGLDKLLNLIPRTVGLGDGAFDGALITNARQAAALARAAERCEAALYAAQSGMTPDAVVMDAEGAITALGEITGETVTDAVVTRIFSDFCVGK